jgi:hypothetical protein
VLHFAFEDVTHGLEASVRVIRRTDGLPGLVLHGPHLIEHQEGIRVAEASRREGTVDDEPRPLELAVGGDHFEDLTARHDALHSRWPSYSTFLPMSGPPMKQN